MINQGQVILNGAAMSKSRGNLVEPSEVYATYGADTLRATILFAGPIQDDIDWADVSPEGTFRWLTRLWRITLAHIAGGDLVSDDSEAVRALRSETHRTIADVSGDFEVHKYNTVIAKLMTLTNAIGDATRAGVRGSAIREALDALVQMLAPIAPFITEALWQRLGHRGSVHASTWPVADAALLVQDTVTIAVQVDGKTRDRLTHASAADRAEVETAARQLAGVARHLDGREVANVVHVPGRLLNFVTGPSG